MADARVGEVVEEVGDEVDGDVGEADGEDASLDQVVVAVGDRLNGEAADSGPGEDGFGDDGAGEQGAELESDDGENGDKSVAEGVLVNDGAFGESFGAGGANVVLAEFFEHGGADHAGEDGGERASHGDGRKDEVVEASCAGHGQPAEANCEEEDENGAEGKVGEGESEEADESEDAVVPAIAAPGGADPGGEGEKDGDKEGGDGESDGVRVALEDDLADILIETDGDAEISGENAVPVTDILLRDGEVESVGVARGLEVGGGSAFAEHLEDGVAGHKVDQKKNDGDDQPEDGEGVEEAGCEGAEQMSKLVSW